MIESPSQQSKKMIQDYYAYFNEKNYPKMLDLMSDDILHQVNQSHEEMGKNKFSDFLKSMDYHYSEKLSQIIILSNEDGTRMAAEFICDGTYLKTSPGLPIANGQKYHLPVGCFFEIKNSKITRITNYYNMSHWVESVSK